jgi:hypothetical protein
VSENILPRENAKTAEGDRTLELCAVAITHVLGRISGDEKVRYYLGAGTEAFGRLTAAYAALKKRPVDEVRDEILPGSASIHCPRREE